MSAQRQKPIDFTAEGLRLAVFVNRNCGIRVQQNAVRKFSRQDANIFYFSELGVLCVFARVIFFPIRYFKDNANSNMFDYLQSTTSEI